MTERQQKFYTALPDSWKKPLEAVCHNPIIDSLSRFLKEREEAGATIYPAKPNIFAALKQTPLESVRVVIVGQDPYHGVGQAHGLSFSVQPGIAVPPSLRNIYKELHSDIGMPIPKNGTLIPWAKHGVLLLNAVLTVEAGKPASHAGKGWEVFTDAIIEQLMRSGHPTVFMLWGSYAQKKVQHLHLAIDPEKHLILKSPHPSPLATGFLGNHHFSQANAFLEMHRLPKIQWNSIEEPLKAISKANS